VSKTDALIEAESLLEQLREHYRQYAGGTEQQEQSRKGYLQRMFGRWLFNGPQVDNPVHLAFLSGAEELAGALALAAAGVAPEERQAGQEAASEAVGIMLAAKPETLSNEAQLFMVAAEQYCKPLLPLLSREQLLGHRERMLARTSRRMMLPKQAEVFDLIEQYAGVVSRKTILPRR